MAKNSSQLTLVDLQKVLGDQIHDILDESKKDYERDRVIENATLTCAVAKQMINNAKVMMNFESQVKDGMDTEHSVLKGIIARDEE